MYKVLSMDYFKKYKAENGKVRPLKEGALKSGTLSENKVMPGYVSKKELIEWAEGEIEKLDQYDRYESGLISGLKHLIEHLKVGK